jgi:hypothetical protein
VDVAAGAVEFFAGPLATDPHRVGKRLDVPFDGAHSARLMREWRVLYVVDDEQSTVTVRSIDPASARCLPHLNGRNRKERPSVRRRTFDVPHLRSAVTSDVDLTTRNSFPARRAATRVLQKVMGIRSDLED